MDAFRFDTVDSTNEMAKRLVVAGRIRESAYVLAREQTAGKGTHGRTWVSPRDAGIYLSVIETQAEESPAPIATLTRAVGAACAETLSSRTGVAIDRRSVNDLFVGQRKLGGILAESVFCGGRMTALIVGVGVNVRKAQRQTPQGAPEAISLQGVMPVSAFSALNVEALVDELVSTVWQCMGQQCRVGSA